MFIAMWQEDEKKIGQDWYLDERNAWVRVYEEVGAQKVPMSKFLTKKAVSVEVFLELTYNPLFSEGFSGVANIKDKTFKTKPTLESMGLTPDDVGESE